MENLKKSLRLKFENELNQFKDELAKFDDVSLLLSRYNYLIPRGSKKAKLDIDSLKAYLLKRKELRDKKHLDLKLFEIDLISDSANVDSFSITVEWKKSSTWGSNPNATIDVKFVDGTHSTFVSGSIGGCGYDKHSTAISTALNQCYGLLKPLYLIKNLPENIGKTNHELFGYGSGYGILPSFEGAVGFRSTQRILEKVGFVVETVSSGKSFDVYKVTRKK